MTYLQLLAFRDAREHYSGVLAYDLGDGRILLSGERETWREGFVPVMFTVDREGDRVNISDTLNISHYLEDIAAGRYPRIEPVR